MTTQSEESKRMLAGLVAECEADRRTAASAWLLGMVPREDQAEVARLAAEIAAAKETGVEAPPQAPPPCAPAPELPDYLRKVWNATLEYLRERSHVEDLAARAALRPSTNPLKNDLDDAQGRAVRKMEEIRALVGEVFSEPVLGAAEGAAAEARNYLMAKAMDVQDAVRMVLRMVQEALPAPKEAAPAPAPPPKPAPEKPVPEAAPAPVKLAAAAPMAGFPFARPSAPRRLGLPFVPAEAPPGRFVPGVFRAAPGLRGTTDE